ncbi:scavenger receptor cysteine-rich type 1 protein M130 [Sebastes umbrosus]|uniref:scavenger receptor cysteine-rich type 1 protein M130 n=1 Tax=Sebastes umbrosus TaxID=72105 RepID=UPI00189D76F2|nr:scavenger receptor cysteine-rich type 1 protein M130 [Sebastes umbrosus]
MWSLLLLLYTAFTEPLITQGDNRLILINGSHPCEGYIGMYHDGQLGYVGHKTWSDNIEKVVCKSTQCGVPKDKSIKMAPSYTWNKVWVNEVNCTGEEHHLWECNYPGWKTSSVDERTLTKIQCSNEIKISLDGFRCAGAVKYQSSTDERETDSGYLCGDNWGKDQKDLLCKTLDCGESKDPPHEDWMDWKEFEDSKRMKINCSGMTNVTHLWQCAPKEEKLCKKTASVMCADFKRLQLQGNPSNVCSGRLEEMKSNVWSNWSEPVSTSKTGPDVWCQQMHCGTNMNHSTDNGTTNLNCSDNVKVVLIYNNQPSKCYGAVNIEVNGSRSPVCANTWTQKEAAVVCKELDCGDVHIEKKKPPGSVKGIMDNVNCSGNEASLWHCSAKHVSSCSSEAYVVCSDSMEVRLADGPGKCAGRVEIQYEGRWQRVHERAQNLNAVCRELGCGNERNSTKRTEKFFQGSGDFLTVTCKSTAKNISECTLQTDEGVKEKAQAQGITCEEHKVVILKGGDSCSGRVGIKHGKNTKWLSGSNETWNQQSANTVCQQMHCGNALSFNSESSADIQKDVWAESYKCSSDTKSLFDCKKNNLTTKLPSDHGNTSATVKCSGKLEVKLSKGCWGNVSVWVDGKKNGSVCADNWEKKKSEMLCKNLDCGDKVLTRITEPGESKALFTSLHCTDEATSLTQCNFVRNERGISCEQAYVVCSGSVEYGFSDTRDKCYGNVVVHYEGRRLPVCKPALDIKTQHIICEKQKCGQAVKEIDYFGPKPVENYLISNITCDNKSITSCNVKPAMTLCELGGLQCSDWRKMALTMGKACSGDVFVHSKEEKISPVSSEGWRATERDRLCQDLQCGKYRSNKTTPLTQSVLWSTSFSCEGVQKPENIWDCENQTSSSQGNTTEQLKIECEGEPSVNLSQTCRGEVKIDGIEVCADQWKDKYSQLVCQEMNCSNAVPDFFHGENPKPGKQYFHVSCEENHFKLGQCKRVKKDCKGRLVSVNCVSQIKFDTSEKCGGQIKVNYRNKWEYVCPLTSFPSKLMDSLCVECDGHNRSIKTPQNESVVTLETTLNCASNTQDIKYCVRTQSCKDVKAAEIYCNEYVFPTIPEPKRIPDRTVEIIVGVGFVLVLVVLIVVFIIICVVRKAKIFSSRKLQRKEVEFESGDYDDVTSKANEMEVLSGGRFPSETEVVTENDARSTSSFPYDDIDDIAVAQPLTSKAATAAASGDNDNHEGDLHQSADGVIYEVDDPQENYEDIEAKIIQTEAEVHNSPQTTPESNAAPPPGLEQGDEDYLVPGQDG